MSTNQDLNITGDVGINESTPLNMGDGGADEGGDVGGVGEIGEGDMDYNKQMSFHTMESSVRISSVGRGFMTFLNGLIASGMLALPHAVAKVGLVPAWLLFFFVGILNYYTMKLLHIVASDMQLVKVDFVKLAEKIYNPKWFKFLVEFNLHFMQFGIAITGLVFITQYFDKIFCILGPAALCDSGWLRFLLILSFVLPIGAITDIHTLSIPNAFGLFFQFSFFLMFTIVCSITLHDNGVAGGFAQAASEFHPEYLPLAFSTILYAYEGIGLIFDIRTAINDNSAFNKVLAMIFLLTTICYTTVGTLGKLAFGDNVNAVIFLNLNQGNHLIVFVEFGYLLAMTIVVPTVLFPVTRIIENWRIFRRIATNSETGKKSFWGRQLIRQPIVLSLCIIAAVIPSFNLFLSFIGGFNFSLLTFVIPILFYNWHFSQDPSRKWVRIFNWCVMIPGIGLGFTASVQAIIDMATGQQG